MPVQHAQLSADILLSNGWSGTASPCFILNDYGPVTPSIRLTRMLGSLTSLTTVERRRPCHGWCLHRLQAPVAGFAQPATMLLLFAIASTAVVPDPAVYGTVPYLQEGE